MTSNWHHDYIRGDCLMILAVKSGFLTLSPLIGALSFGVFKEENSWVAIPRAFRRVNSLSAAPALEFAQLPNA